METFRILHLFLFCPPDGRLPQDAEQLGDFVRVLNENLLPWKLYFRLHIGCGPKAVEAVRRQAARSADPGQELYLFLFCTALDDATRIALDEVLQQFSAGKKRNVLLFFRSDVRPSADVTALKTELLQRWLHYAGEYTHVDSIKLRLINSLGCLGLSYLPLSCTDGQIRLGEEGLLPTDRLPAFAKNPVLADLQGQKAALEPRYFDLRERYLQDPDGCYREYAAVAARREALIKAIREQEKQVFQLDRTLDERLLGDGVSEKLLRARALLDRGELEAAVALLDRDEIMEGYRHRRLLHRQLRAQDRIAVSESLGRAGILRQMPSTPERQQQICQAYEDAVEITLNAHLQPDALEEYADWLYDQNQYTRAIEIMEQLLAADTLFHTGDAGHAYRLRRMGALYRIADRPEAEAYLQQALELYRTVVQQQPEYEYSLAVTCAELGSFYASAGRPKTGEELYYEALGIFRKLARIKPELYQSAIAAICNSLGDFCTENGRPQQAEEFYSEAMSIRRGRVQTNPESESAWAALAGVCRSMGLFCSRTGRNKEAEALLCEALAIHRRLAQSQPEAYLPYVADTCGNLGAFYTDTGRPQQAQALLCEAVDIYRTLTQSQAEAFLPNLAMCCNNLGLFYKRGGRFQQAQELLREALEIYRAKAEILPEIYLPQVASVCVNLAQVSYGHPKEQEKLHLEALAIRRELAAQQPEQYRIALADASGNLGSFYSNNGRPKEAERLLGEALEMYRDLAQSWPEAHRPNLAKGCNNLGIFYSSNGRPQKAEQLLREALDIRRELAKTQPEIYLKELASSCGNLGDFYAGNGRPQEAERLLREALDIRRTLAQSWPEAYLADLASGCSNLGVFYAKRGRPQDAERLYLEALEIRRTLAQSWPEAYLADLASGCNNLGIFYSRNGRPQQAEQLLGEALAISRKLADGQPEAYLPHLAVSCSSLASFCADNGRPQQAEALYREALEIDRRLADAQPEAYRPVFAGSCNNLANLYADNSRPQAAEELYREALEIYRELANARPEAYLPDLARLCNNLGQFYEYNLRPQQAGPILCEALEAYRDLVRVQPEAYRPGLATVCNNLGNYYARNGRPDQAKELYLEALEIRRELIKTQPEAYRPDLADTCSNLAGFYRNIGAPRSAEPLYCEALGIYRTLQKAGRKPFCRGWPPSATIWGFSIRSMTGQRPPSCCMRHWRSAGSWPKASPRHIWQILFPLSAIWPYSTSTAHRMCIINCCVPPATMLQRWQPAMRSVPKWKKRSTGHWMATSRLRWCTCCPMKPTRTRTMKRMKRPASRRSFWQRSFLFPMSLPPARTQSLTPERARKLPVRQKMPLRSRVLAAPPCTRFYERGGRPVGKNRG